MQQLRTAILAQQAAKQQYRQAQVATLLAWLACFGKPTQAKKAAQKYGLLANPTTAQVQTLRRQCAMYAARQGLQPPSTLY
jgi:hypothetical protein